MDCRTLAKMQQRGKSETAELVLVLKRDERRKTRAGGGGRGGAAENTRVLWYSFYACPRHTVCFRGNEKKQTFI